jgi:formylmethanofuran dehydrogenase subunit C
MSIKLTLYTLPEAPLEAEVISPDKLAGLSAAEIAALPVQHGNERAALGEFFKVVGNGNKDVELEGDLSEVRMLGVGMSDGRLVIHGPAGMHLGAGMSGGNILVEGDAGDWAGAEMLGGRLVIKGNAGHLVGCAYRGSPTGMQGGEIIIHGHAGNEIGGTMRRGLIAVGGDSGDFTGVNLRAGTIIVLGQFGERPGASMLRGTLVSMRPVELLPTFHYACTYHPSFLRLYLLQLQAMGLPVSDAQLHGQYQRWSGDSVELNRGEILMFEGALQ